MIQHSLLTPSQLADAAPRLWTNDREARMRPASVHDDAVDAAEDRLKRAHGLLQRLFPALAALRHPLRSPLLPADALAKMLGAAPEATGRWLTKCDHRLPVAGSVKARGGFHEVIAFAERVASENGLIGEGAELSPLAGSQARALFARHSVVVGSTGNLGMSIGLVAAALGFRAVVHMSRDAKAWKKARLRAHGAEVVEHSGDYARAVATGRAAAEADPFAHFVDDEQSLDLFVGYAAAARELAEQLAEQGIGIDAEHPLFVYIPCGVGGAPGGITYGLKRLFGPHVHCFFAEPVQSPCMLVQMLADNDDGLTVYDVGLTNRTEADGLAVGQASMLVAPLMRDRLAGIYTVTDDQLFALLRAGSDALSLGLEPSAAAALAGPLFLTQTGAGRAYLEAWGGRDRLARATHILWTTGGSLVPDDERARYLARAAATPFELLAR